MSDENLVVEFQLTRLDEVTRGLGQVAARLTLVESGAQRAAKAMRDLNKEAAPANVAAPSSAPSRMGTGKGGGGSNVPPAPPAALAPSPGSRAPMWNMVLVTTLRVSSLVIGKSTGAANAGTSAALSIQTINVNTLNVRGAGGGGSGSGGGGRGSTSPGFLGGPAQRLQQAHANLLRANQTGTPAERFDASVAFRNASNAYQKVANPAGPPSFLNKLKDAVMTSRIGAGTGMMPLVNRVVGLFGPAATTAAAGLALLAEETNRAAQSLLTFRDAMLTSGGTTAETAQSKAMGAAIGLGEGDMAKMARQFTDNISKGGIGAGYAGQAGIVDVGVMDSTDKMKKLLKFIDYLRVAPEQEAVRAARSTGTEDLLKFRSVSSQTMKELKQDALATAKIFNPEQTRAAAEYEAQIGRLSNALENARTVAFEPFIGMLATIAEGVANGLQRFAAFMERLQKMTVDWANSIPGLNPYPAKTPEDKARVKAMQDKEKNGSALDDNTNAVNANTAALKSGIFGGGDRARGALPGKMTGVNAHQWISPSINMGAFSL